MQFFLLVQVRDRTIVAVAAVLQILVGFVALIARKKFSKQDSLLIIEAGEKGWELIEYQEIYESACEYIGRDLVEKLIVLDRNYYLQSVKNAIKSAHPTHYFYDPRTGNQSFCSAILDAFYISLLLRIYGVTPLCWLTDLPMRRWRLQCAIVSASKGITITLMSPRQISHYFPHRRLVGPVPMPISIKTISWLHEKIEYLPRRESPIVRFVGSLYEPRTTMLYTIDEGLKKQGFHLEIHTRQLGGPRLPNEEYWYLLVTSDILITTADQIVAPGADETGFPHLIYRYSEALASGALLIAPLVPGIERYFVPEVHFVPFTSAESAISVIVEYINNNEIRLKKARCGADKMLNIVESKLFWNIIDLALTKNSLL